MQKMKTETIVWDLDGTILDSFGIHEDIMGQVLPMHGLKVPTRELMLANYHGPLEHSIGNAIEEEISEEELQAIINDFLLIDNEYITHPDDLIFRDALELAQKAHGLDIAQLVVTNRAHGVNRGNASPRTLIQNSMLRDAITRIICRDDSEHKKPKPEVLEGVVYNPETTVVIGDQFVDAQFAHNIGARAVLVCRNEEIPHLEQLEDGWESRVQVVKSLADVTL